MRVYCDTCVYMDLFEDRKNGFRSFAQSALHFFALVREGEYEVVVSDWVRKEIMKLYGDAKNLDELLSTIPSYINVTIDKKDRDRAKELSEDNFDDALHVALALKADAKIITTRNIKHFQHFSDIIDVELPEFL